eukprot:scaffold206663_cov12-Tisochrysis_lutea.AAC.1
MNGAGLREVCLRGLQMDLNLQKKGAGEHFEKVCEKGVLEGAAAGPHPAKDQADMRTKIACVC